MCLRQVSVLPCTDTVTGHHLLGVFISTVEDTFLFLRRMRRAQTSIQQRLFSILKQFCIATRLDCSSCKEMPGSLTVASTAALSPNIAVVYSVEVDRCVVHNRYKRPAGHCPVYTHIDCGVFCGLSPNLYGKVSPMQIGL
jgi:hypothetical protein